jgi:murein DD-endopeptidase MepM/ murein hydrolase activator NlpD
MAYAREEATAVATGHIGKDTPSLFEAMEAAGESVDLSIELAAVFSGEIDFNSELQPGDSFRVAFQKITRENGTVAYGAIRVAEFNNDGRRLEAFRFELPDGKAGYYDANGRSLKRFFLKSPLKFEPRVTSHFSYSRRHPVLNVRRAHLGVDYAAPIGAPVVAVSNGVVARAGFSGDAGRLVAVRHSSGYESLYLHLSSVAVRVGQRVSQGELVGRVGSSGLSTGPHLDYRLRKNGSYVNPLTEHRRMPPGDPIPASLMAAFTAERDNAAALLQASRPQPSASGAPEPAAAQGRR